MEDYKEFIKKMILDMYVQNPELHHNKCFLHLNSTADILEMVQGVIPKSPINEHDIFEIMVELGFEIGRTPNYIFLWKMYTKTNIKIKPKKVKQKEE